MSRRVAMLVSNACAPDRRVVREAEALVGRGHHVTVIAWDREGSHVPHEGMSGVQIERIRVPSAYGLGLQRLRQWPAFARQALAHLKRANWDAVHCHDLDTLPVGYAYTRGRRVPLVFDAHESYPDLVAPKLPRWAVLALRATERFLVPRVDALITVGDLLAGHYRRWVQRVAVVRNCQPMSAESSDPRTLRLEWELDRVDLVVCYIGGFTYGRVILPLIEVIKTDPTLGLVLVGEGPQSTSLLTAAEGVDRIRYLGKRVPPDQVVSIMQGADIVYYGLRSDYPNNRFSSPNALYSALAAGRPLLTTNVGEVSLVVQAEECGVILDKPTKEAIVVGLAKLRDATARKVMARNARLAAKTRYNWSAAEQELLSLYRELWGEV